MDRSTSTYRIWKNEAVSCWPMVSEFQNRQLINIRSYIATSFPVVFPLKYVVMSRKIRFEYKSIYICKQLCYKAKNININIKINLTHWFNPFSLIGLNIKQHLQKFTMLIFDLSIYQVNFSRFLITLWLVHILRHIGDKILIIKIGSPIHQSWNDLKRFLNNYSHEAKVP